MTDYREAVNLIKMAESKSSVNEQEFSIDPQELQASVEIRRLAYGEVIRQLGFEKEEKGPEAPAAEKAKPEEMAQARPKIAAKPFAVQKPQSQPKQAAEAEAAKPQIQPQPQAQAPAQAGKPLKPRKQLFAQELKSATASLEKIAKVSKEIEEAVSKQKEEKKLKGLVLPTLSLSDQISDLEKIKEGLEERVFNEQQLEIIKLEANGLARLIAEGKQPNAPTDLAETRNSLLKEVIDMVGGYAV
jgi:chaperonin cofactor prefoldin